MTAPAPQILIIEDDAAVQASLTRRLRFEGFGVEIADSGEDGLKKLEEATPDLILLDVMLPGMDGFATAETIRKTSNVPILMLTAKDSVEDRVDGLMCGADDYLVKPFEMPELIARIRALIRRSQLTKPAQAEQNDSLLQFLGLSMEQKTREVLFDEKPLQLTPREYDLLEYLLRHPRQVLTREQILEAVWGYDSDATSNLVDVYVRQLRKKMEQASPKSSPQLGTVRGVGYTLREPDGTALGK